MNIAPLPAPGPRDQKKAATRLAISNVATALFVEHGFEAVSVDEVARAAGVSRKTVFNYFARKEDLVFDREEEGRALIRAAIIGRGAQPPVQAFQALMRTLVMQQHPLFRINERPLQFWRTVADSPALTARARELQVTLAEELAELFAEAVGKPAPDADARLAATLLMGTLVVAYRDALQAFGTQRDPAAALLRVMERGFRGVDAALAGSVYA